jgi:hypothetical protein
VLHKWFNSEQRSSFAISNELLYEKLGCDVNHFYIFILVQIAIITVKASVIVLLTTHFIVKNKKHYSLYSYFTWDIFS